MGHTTLYLLKLIECCSSKSEPQAVQSAGVRRLGIQDGVREKAIQLYCERTRRPTGGGKGGSVPGQHSKKEGEKFLSRAMSMQELDFLLLILGFHKETVNSL